MPTDSLKTLVPEKGLEPPPLSGHGPQPCASTNSATQALGCPALIDKAAEAGQDWAPQGIRIIITGSPSSPNFASGIRSHQELLIVGISLFAWFAAPLAEWSRSVPYPCRNHDSPIRTRLTTCATRRELPVSLFPSSPRNRTGQARSGGAGGSRTRVQEHFPSPFRRSPSIPPSSLQLQATNFTLAVKTFLLRQRRGPIPVPFGSCVGWESAPQCASSTTLPERESLETPRCCSRLLPAVPFGARPES